MIDRDQLYSHLVDQARTFLAGRLLRVTYLDYCSNRVDHPYFEKTIITMYVRRSLLDILT